MTEATTLPQAAPGPRAAIWALLFGNLLIGTGVQLPIGLLDLIAADLQVSASQAGLIVFVGGIVVGAGAPLLAWATSRTDRRLLLTASLAIYAAGHLATVFAPTLWLVLVLRGVTMIGAAVFTPQAASAVGLMVPPEDRAKTIAFIFIGWSLAAIAGLPVGRLLGTWLGWHNAYLVMAILSVAGMALVWSAMPRGLRAVPLSLASWGQVFTSPVLLSVLAVTLLMASGQFTMFAYAAPVMGGAFGIPAGQIAVVFGLMGVAGVTGNYVASRLVRRLGIETTIHISLALIALGMAITLAGWGWPPAFVAGGIVTGMGTFSSNSMQQSRLVVLAPPLAAATVALNTSGIYLGQAVGSTAGGAVMAQVPPPTIAVIGVVFVAAALIVSIFATRLGRTQ